MTKIAGSGSGSISQREAWTDPHQNVLDPEDWAAAYLGISCPRVGRVSCWCGSADPDPHQNVMDPDDRLQPTEEVVVPE
jgi:hypothetical protein